MYDPAELAEVAKLYIKTGSYADTSKKFGFSEKAAVRRIDIIIKKSLLPKKIIDQLVKVRSSNARGRISEDESRQMAKLYASVGHIKDCADILGISLAQAKRRLEAAKKFNEYNPDAEIIKDLNTKINKLKETVESKDVIISQQEEDIKIIAEDPTIVLNRDRSVLKLKDDIKNIKNSLKLSEKEVKILADHNEILTKIDGRKIKHSNKIIASTTRAEATAVMIASDWHVEEPVDPDGLDGFNEYNLEIAAERGRNFFKNGLYLIKKEMQNAKIDNVVLGLLGDFISNYIHEELEEQALLSPVLALEFAEDIILEGIDFLLKDGSFKNLIIPCCFGNHGRTTKKMRFSTGWQNSYETLMYRHIQKLYANDPRVDVRLTKGYHNLLDIYGHTIRFHHGDAMRGGQGIGGITIPVNRSIGRWNIKEMATLDVFGHFHQLQFQSRFVCNGSLIGYNQFAQRFGCEPEEPRQAFFLIDKDHGRTVCAPIFVKD